MPSLRTSSLLGAYGGSALGLLSCKRRSSVTNLQAPPSIPRPLCGQNRAQRTTGGGFVCQLLDSGVLSPIQAVCYDPVVVSTTPEGISMTESPGRQRSSRLFSAPRETIRIPKQSGRAFVVTAGELVKVIDVDGEQVADLVCFDYPD